MALIEVQIRTDRLCKLIEGEINSSPLDAPTIDHPSIAGKLLERIECKDCRFAESWAENLTAFESTFVFQYYNSLEAEVRPSGSFGVGMPSALETQVYVGLRMKKADNGQWRIEYELFLGRGLRSIRTGVFPIGVPSGIVIAAAELVGTEELVSIRIATDAADLAAPVVNKLGAAEWCQTVPGKLIADEIRKVLDRALEDAVRPPQQPESWEWWKPRPKHKELRKEGPARAVWFTALGFATAQGDVTAVDACPIADIDVGIELTLTVMPQSAPDNVLRTIATLSWHVDSTLCSVATGALVGIPVDIGLGIPVGIAVAVIAGNEVSQTILGKHIGNGGFQEIGRDGDSITFEQIAVPPPPSLEFAIATLATTAEGILTFGTITPKVRARLEGSATPPLAGIWIDCNIRSVGLKFSSAEVLLWSVPGDKKRPDFQPKPLVFVDEIKFEPPNAWKIEAKDFLKSASVSTPGDMLLVLRDPDTGRLPVGTATSMYLATNLGVRWVDLGTIPAMDPDLLLGAERLMNSYCDSISNPWAQGLTKLEWVDPLLDPDYDHSDRFRFWTLGLQGLPPEARIEFVAIGADGVERPIGLVEGMKEAVLEVLTSPSEALAFRVRKGFYAPRPTVARGWFVPTRGVGNHEEHVRNNLLAASASDSERMVRERRTRLGWAAAPRLKTGERFVKHGQDVVVGVIRGIERIQ